MNMDTREIIFVCNTHRGEVEGEVAVKVEMDSWNQFYEYIKTGDGKYGKIDDFKSLKVPPRQTSASYFLFPPFLVDLLLFLIYCF